MWNGEKRPCSAHCPPDESSSISQRERNCEVRFKKNQLQFIGQRLTFVIDRVHHQLQEEIWPPFRATPFNSTPCNLRREQVTGRRSMTPSLTNPIWFDFSLSLSVSSPTNSKKSFLFLTGKLATRSVTPHWWLKKPKKIRNNLFFNWETRQRGRWRHIDGPKSRKIQKTFTDSPQTWQRWQCGRWRHIDGRVTIETSETKCCI